MCLKANIQAINSQDTHMCLKANNQVINSLDTTATAYQFDGVFKGLVPFSYTIQKF